MVQTVKIKNSQTTTNVPASLVTGEVAINEQDELLFYRDGAGAVQSINLANPGGGAFLPLAGGALTGALAMGNNLITGLATPVAGTDAATKAYADGVASGLDVKSSVRVASTANVNLAATTGGALQDGVTLVNGEDILLKNQTTGSQNGIYTAVTAANPSTWVRRSDADISAEVTSGMFTFVSEGTANAAKGFVLATADPIVLNTTSLAFTQFSEAGQIVDGAGLAFTGNVLDVGAGTGITVNANDIQISATYVGQGSIVTVGTIATGTWSATNIALAKGGTGADLSALAAGALMKINVGQTAMEAAVEGTDFLSSTSTIDGGTF